MPIQQINIRDYQMKFFPIKGPSDMKYYVPELEHGIVILVAKTAATHDKNKFIDGIPYICLRTLVKNQKDVWLIMFEQELSLPSFVTLMEQNGHNPHSGEIISLLKKS